MASEYEQYSLPDPEGVPINQDAASDAALGTPSVKSTLQGSYQSTNFVHGVSGWYLGSDTAEFNIGVSVSSINIPDTTTASSFHVDSSGNSWWGANVAGGYTTANAYILASGAAVFKNVQIGGTTIQYVITNSGIFSYGDGSDGTATCDGSTAVAGMSRSSSIYTMTRDVYFTTLTINNGVTVKTAGYRIFTSNTLNVSGTIDRSGNDGGNGSNGTDSVHSGNDVTNGGSGGGGGSAGAALADGYLKGAVAGKVGGGGGHGWIPSGGGSTGGSAGSNGTDGDSTSNSIGGNGSTAGAAGDGNSTPGGSYHGGTPGNGGTATLSNVKLIANWHLATLLDVSSSGSTVKFDNSAGSGSAGGGSGGGCGPNYIIVGSDPSASGGGGGGGGGSGSAGGIIAIYARSIVISATGVIQANGGKGGNGGNGGNGFAATGSYGSGDNLGGGGGGGGGGAGGDGGQIILVYNALTNSGSITVTGGVAGTKGTGGTGISYGFGGGSTSRPGGDGSDGNAGSAGTIRQFQLSL